MKKRHWIIITAILVLLFLPIPTGVYKDGGTRVYSALTYKIVDWNRMTGDTIYDETKIYWFPYNFKSIDGLWYYEEDRAEHIFNATVLDIYDGSVLVSPDSSEKIAGSCDKISFGTRNLPALDITVGSRVVVAYKGCIMESYPAQILATDWELID